MINKVLGRMDPLRQVPTPHGGLYRASRFVRDLPLAHPVAAGGGLAALTLATMGTALPAIALGYGAATLYATGAEAVAAIPSFGRFLERIGSPSPEFTAPMIDTQAARNMRQATLRAMHDSGFLLRSVLGREARLLHR